MPPFTNFAKNKGKICFPKSLGNKVRKWFENITELKKNIQVSD